MTSTAAGPAADRAPGPPEGRGVVLADVLAHRRWVRRERPFPHVVARDVFVPPVAEALDAQFRQLLRERPEAFARTMAGYDASGLTLDQVADGPLGLFASRAWHDLVAGLFGVDGTGDVSASLHHHEPGSRDGWPHNDLNPGWFADPPAGADDVRLARSGGVDYHRGTRPDGVQARETVRAVSLLYYLANPPWQPGDGGETALYADAGGGRPALTVPPVNNSLVAFECTPWSWHGFVSNRRTPRNSVVLWVHRPKDEVVTRWGDDRIAYW